MRSEKYVSPSYQLPSGQWSFQFGRGGNSGGVFPNVTKCNAARNAKIAAFENGTVQAQPNKSFGIILDELEADEKKRAANEETTDATRCHNEYVVKNVIRPEFGHLKLKDITHARMQKFQQGLVNTGQNSRSESCRTVWRLAFDLCCREGYCPINLARVGEPLVARGSDPRTQICTDDQYAKLIAVTEAGWDGTRGGLSENQRRNIDAAVKLARYHRCRKQDICGLRPIARHPSAGFGSGGHGAR